MRLRNTPFVIQEDAPLLEHQQRHFDILKVHSQQGGFCLILGEPGTGKTILKNAIVRYDPKQWITPVINRSLHTWPNRADMPPATSKPNTRHPEPLSMPEKSRGPGQRPATRRGTIIPPTTQLELKHDISPEIPRKSHDHNLAFANGVNLAFNTQRPWYAPLSPFSQNWQAFC